MAFSLRVFPSKLSALRSEEVYAVVGVDASGGAGRLRRLTWRCHKRFGLARLCVLVPMLKDRMFGLVERPGVFGLLKVFYVCQAQANLNFRHVSPLHQATSCRGEKWCY